MTAAAGFHTFDYARHFLSCCSRMLGLEHETSRGSISLEYYGRTVGIKIMPTGEAPLAASFLALVPAGHIAYPPGKAWWQCMLRGQRALVCPVGVVWWCRRRP